jgi:sugar transferase (PEP-CTERM/EpsH1 system associated)
MDVLFVVPYAPNLIRTRSYNLIRHLSRRGNRVTVLALWANEQERADLEQLKQECYHVEAMSMPAWRSLWNCMMALPSKAPLQSVYSWRPDLVTRLNGNVDFDVVHVEHLRGSRYGLYLKQQKHLPVVWDSVDCISHLFQQAFTHNNSLSDRLRSRLELRRTERYESWLLDKFDRVLVTSPVDKQAFASMKANGGTAPVPISVLENGVDLDYFAPDSSVAREPATLVVSGKMSYHANVAMTTHLVQEIMPYVWECSPDVKLWIVGKDPVQPIQALAENPRVTVTGTVDDVRPFLRQATIAVTPVAYGAGIQNKVLEAMACATPVVTTPQAISAIDIVPGRDALVVEEPHLFAGSIVELLGDPERQRRLGEFGLSYVRAHHRWTDVAAKLEEFYCQTIHMKDQAIAVG